MMTTEECLKKAFACLLENDLEGRDRWLKLAGNVMSGNVIESIQGGGIKVHRYSYDGEFRQ